MATKSVTLKLSVTDAEYIARALKAQANLFTHDYQKEPFVRLEAYVKTVVSAG